MTFEELDARFPNGFDDAEILAITVDYVERAATFRLRLRPNPPESPDRDVYSGATLNLKDLYYLSVEPPDAEHLFHPGHGRITVDGLSEDPKASALQKRLSTRLAPGAFCCRFYVHDWNSFIHVAAARAEFSFLPSLS